MRSNYWDIYQQPALRQSIESWDILDPFITNILLDSETEIDATYYSPEFHESDVGFFDFHLAGSYQVNNNSTLSGSIYIADNHVETRLLNRQAGNRFEIPYIYATDTYNWNNLMGQVSWHQWITPRLDLSVQAS